MLKRLRKEYESYEKETLGIRQKLEKLEQEITIIEKDQELDLHIRKQKEFLGQSQSVLTNVKQKLIEAFEGLTQFLSQKSEEESVVGTSEKEIAQNLVLEVETYLENLE